MTRKILFVGMINSPHAARWIELIADSGWDLHFFPVYAAEPHSILRNITIHHPWISFYPRKMFRNFLSLAASYFGFKKAYPINNNILKRRAIYPIPVTAKYEKKLHEMNTNTLGESDVCAKLAFGPPVLARLIKKIKPDLIHSMEFQHASYTVLKVKENFQKRKFPKWLATNWGSDIYYYRQFSDHKKQITRLLKNIDFYSCECTRDIALAQELELNAKLQFVLPNTGGFDIDKISPIRSEFKTSLRKSIMIKGYQHFAGRALIALDALETCADLLKGYTIYVYAASMVLYQRIDELRRSMDLDVTILPLVTHDKMLELFAQARIYLAVSISDAISTSMLEAMAMGAFPIQTNTSCCEEWIKDGQSGFSIPPDDPKFIGEKLREALTNDALVDSAAEINWSIVCNQLDKNVLRKKEIEVYDEIFKEMEK